MTHKFRKLKTTELNRKSVDEFKQSVKIPIVVVLDNIRSLHNVGSVFRTADAFRIQAVYLCGYTPKPPHREIHKTALGATETVDWLYFETPDEVIRKLESLAYAVIPVEQTENSTRLQDFRPEGQTGIALVFGNEVEGVSELFLNKAGRVIEIPQEGTKHSLNVSVCVGIILWEMIRYFNNR